MDTIAEKEAPMEVHDPRDDEQPYVRWAPLALVRSGAGSVHDAHNAPVLSPTGTRALASATACRFRATGP